MTLTTDEAALLVGVKPTTVYRWVREGKLAPVRSEARPIRFREEDVTGVARRHRSSRRHAAAVRLWHVARESDANMAQSVNRTTAS